MSIMHFDSTSAASADTFTVALSGGTSQDQTGFIQASASWITYADGTIWRIQGGAYSQVNSGSDWITPRTGFDPLDYEIRMNFTGNGSANHSGYDTWLPMNIIRYWTFICNRFCVEATIITFDIRHATNGSKNTESSLEDGAPCMATSDQFFVYIEAT